MSFTNLLFLFLGLGGFLLSDVFFVPWFGLVVWVPGSRKE